MCRERYLSVRAVTMVISENTQFTVYSSPSAGIWGAIPLKLRKELLAHGTGGRNMGSESLSRDQGS